MSNINSKSLLLVSCTMVAFPAGNAVAQETSGAQNSAGIEEIVVTAQRRNESAQDVPLSVSVVSASLATAMGVTDTASLEAAVPGLQFTRSLNNATPALRGIGSNPSAPLGSESAVATYIDGVYITSPAASLFSFNNIERIEVLKGPQGTLFGRNATGGVVQVVTRDPESTTGVDMHVGYGNYDTVEGSVYGTTGLAENLAADVAIFYENQNDGWGRNLANGKKAFTDKQFGARTKWLVAPTEHMRITLAADYNRTKTDVGVGQSAFPGTVAGDFTTGPAGFYNVYADKDNWTKTKQKGVSLKVEQDLEWARFVSISSYRHVTSDVSYDGDKTANPAVRNDIFINSTDRTLTQELQLLSSDKSAIDCIVGLFYFNDKAKFDPLLSTRGDIFNQQDTRSYAAYGQATGNLGESTRLTLGLRYTTDKRQQDGRIEFGGVVVFDPPGANSKFSKLTYRVALDHRFSPDFLAYASYNRGFKSGLFNLVSPGSPGVRPEVIDAFEVGFKSDLFDKRLQFNVAGFYYEFNDLQVSLLQGTTTRLVNAGKSDSKGFDIELQARPFGNLRLNSSISYIDAKFVDYTGAPISSANPTGALCSNGRATPTCVDIGSATGNYVPRAPKWSANIGGVYTIPVEGAKIQIAANYYYNNGYYWDPDNRLKQPSYSLLNTSIGWEADSGVSVRAWGKNLLNKKYYSLAGASVVGDMGSPAAPRTYGATIGYRF